MAAGEARQHSTLRSLASVPVDYGVLCLVAALSGLPAVFGWVYGTLAIGFTLVTAASMVAWYRQVAALDGTPVVTGVTVGFPDAGPADPRRAGPRPTTGYVPGAWDLFHVGHLNILRRARQSCDELVVGAGPTRCWPPPRAAAPSSRWPNGWRSSRA